MCQWHVQHELNRNAKGPRPEGGVELCEEVGPDGRLVGGSAPEATLAPPFVDRKCRATRSVNAAQRQRRRPNDPTPPSPKRHPVALQHKKAGTILGHGTKWFRFGGQGAVETAAGVGRSLYPSSGGTLGVVVEGAAAGAAEEGGLPHTALPHQDGLQAAGGPRRFGGGVGGGDEAHGHIVCSAQSAPQFGRVGNDPTT